MVASASYFSGYTSITLTIQSLSVPDVDAKRLAMILPETVTSSVSVSLSHESTSGRRSTKRWSSTNQTGQPVRTWIGRGLYGTGLAGSDTYESKASPVGGAVKDNLRSDWK